MNDLNNINTAIASLNPKSLLRVILYEDKNFNKETDCKILTASIKFMKDTQRFEKPLFQCMQIILELLQLISDKFLLLISFLMYFCESLSLTIYEGTVLFLYVYMYSTICQYVKCTEV